MTNQHIVIGTLVGSSSTGMIHKVSRLGTAACATAVRYGSRGVNLRGVHELEEIVGTFCVRCFPIVEEVVVAEVAPVVEEFNYQTVIPSDAAIIRNSNIRPDDEERCLICSRPVNPTASATVTVHMTTDGTLFPVMDEGLWSDPRSQGAWYVGGECAKKIPAAFKSPTVVVDTVETVASVPTSDLSTSRDGDTVAAIDGIANSYLAETNVSVVTWILAGTTNLSVIVHVDGIAINNGITVTPADFADLSATAALIANTAESAAAVHESETPAGKVPFEILSVEEIAAPTVDEEIEEFRVVAGESAAARESLALSFGFAWAFVARDDNHRIVATAPDLPNVDSCPEGWSGEIALVRIPSEPEIRDWEVVTPDGHGGFDFQDGTFAPTLADATEYAQLRFGPTAIARPSLTDDEKSVDPYPVDGARACGVTREGTLGYQRCVLAVHSDAIMHLSQDSTRFGENPCGCEHTNHWDDEFGPRVDGIHEYLAVAAGSHVANFVGPICDLCAVVCIPTFVADAEANR